MLEEIKQFYQKEGLKAQMVIMPILFLIEFAIKPNRTLFGHIQAFVFLYLATMSLVFLIIYLGKKI